MARVIREERLLERLIHLNEEEKPKRSNVERLIQSVTDHLKKILSTRRGTVKSVLDYGTCDFCDLPGNFVSPETELIQESIQGAIEKYEPRVREVNVAFEGSSSANMTIDFSISATIHHLEHIIPIRLRTSMSPDHTFDVDLVK